jgi:hypothetical protein
MTLNTTLVRFAFVFAGAFAPQFAAFEASRGSYFEKLVIDDLALTPTAALINGSCRPKPYASMAAA